MILTSGYTPVVHLNMTYLDIPIQTQRPLPANWAEGARYGN